MIDWKKEFENLLSVCNGRLTPAKFRKKIMEFNAFYAGSTEQIPVQPMVSQPGRAGSKGGPKIIGVVELRAISALLKIIDDAVQRQVIDSRSAIADARLNCCEPFTYFDGVE